MDALKEVFTGKTRKVMNLVFSAGIAALGVWATFTASMEGWVLPDIYYGILAAWGAFGGYLGLQSSANIDTSGITQCPEPGAHDPLVD